MEEDNKNIINEEGEPVANDMMHEPQNDESTNVEAFATKDKEDNKLMAVLCYLSLLALIPYFAEKNSKWVRHHAIIGMNILIIELIGCVFSLIPFLGGIVGMVISIYTFVISIMGIINVLNCEDKELPLLKNFQIIKK